MTPSGLGGTGGLYSTSTTLNLALAKGSDSSGVAGSGCLPVPCDRHADLDRQRRRRVWCVRRVLARRIGSADPRRHRASDNTCYAYRYSVPDVLGNYSTFASGIIKVDTTAADRADARLLGLNGDLCARVDPVLPPGAGGRIVHRHRDDDGHDVRHRELHVPDARGGLDVDRAAGDSRTYSWTADGHQRPALRRYRSPTTRASTSGELHADAGLDGADRRDHQLLERDADAAHCRSDHVHHRNRLRLGHSHGRASASAVDLLDHHGLRRDHGTYTTLVTNPTSPYADTGATKAGATSTSSSSPTTSATS